MRYFQPKLLAQTASLSRVVACCLLGCSLLWPGSAAADPLQHHITTVAPIHTGAVTPHGTFRGDVLIISGATGGTLPTINTTGSITTGTLTLNTSISTQTATFNVTATGSTGNISATGSGNTGFTLPGTVNITSVSNLSGGNINASSSSASSVAGGTVIISSGNIQSLTLTATGVTGANGAGSGSGITAPRTVVPPVNSVPAAAQTPPPSDGNASISAVFNILDTALINQAAMIGLVNATNLTLAANSAVNQGRRQFLLSNKTPKDEITFVQEPAPPSEHLKKVAPEEGDFIIDTDSESSD